MSDKWLLGDEYEPETVNDEFFLVASHPGNEYIYTETAQRGKQLVALLNGDLAAACGMSEVQLVEKLGFIVRYRFGQKTDINALIQEILDEISKLIREGK